MNQLLSEVRGFLQGLRSEWPEIFAPPPRLIVRPISRPARPAPPSRAERREAYEIFSRRTAHYAAAMGVTYRRIFIKDQRSLWGSCSRAGNLNFNWRVTLAPSEVLDYLVVHELAHLLEMNHSRRFWAHVERQCPNYKSHRRWLRENANQLRDARR